MDVVSCWLLSSVLVLLRLLNAHKIVEFKVFFYIMMFALSFVLVLMLVAYAAVWYKVRARQNEFRGRQRRYSRVSVEHEQKLVLTLLIVTGVFFVTWLPFHFLNIVVFFCAPCVQKLTENLVRAIKLLHYSNSFMNLIIYRLRFPEFRRTLCRVCNRHFRVKREQSRAIGRGPSSLKRNNRTPVEIEGFSKISH